MSQEYLPQPGVRRVRHDPGCEAYLPSGSCDCGNARFVDEDGREISVGKKAAVDLLVQVAKADEWLVLCPRDSVSLTLLEDGTERCPECGWHTGDDLVAPEEVERLKLIRERRLNLLCWPIYAVMFGLLLFLFSLTDFAHLPAWFIVWGAVACATVAVGGRAIDLRWREGPQRTVADLKPPPQGVGAGMRRLTNRALPPPPKGHRSRPQPPLTKLPAICSKCGGYTDPSTGGWCSSCSTYASQRRKKDREVRDGDWSYQQAKALLDRQIISSFSVPPPHLGPVAMVGTRLPSARLGTSMSSTDTTLLLDRPAPWREGALVEVVIDAGLTSEERVLVAPQGPVLLVQCRGYDQSTAQPHSAGAWVQVVRANQHRRMRPMP